MEAVSKQEQPSYILISFLMIRESGTCQLQGGEEEGNQIAVWAELGQVHD